MKVVWNWWKEFKGTVPKDEAPIVTLGRAGIMFSVNENDDVNINNLKEALMSDGQQERSVLVEITVADKDNTFKYEGEIH